MTNPFLVFLVREILPQKINVHLLNVNCFIYLKGNLYLRIILILNHA